MTTFGRYTLVRKVGTGGMAEIWKAKAQGPQGFEKVLAIKKVLPHLVEDGEFIEMFVAEAKLVAGLVHPNIVQVFDFGQIGKQDYFIAMEYVPGSNLAQLIRRIGERKSRVPIEVSLYIALEACKGLGYAHSKTDNAGEAQNIVHRDVSPQNILVSYGGEVKVTDFGIAKVTSALSRTAEGHVRGKLAYMSPEQAHTKSLDNRSDLFSLGVVLYELVTGRRLFAGSSSSEIYAKVADFEPPSPETLGGIPDEVQSVLRIALQPDPEERYQDAIALEGALAHALGPEAIVQARHALASIVQRLFEDERRLETEVAPTNAGASAPSSGPIPEFVEDARTVASGSSVTMTGGEQVVEPNPVPREPRRTPTNPSGLTLAKPATGKQPVRVLAEVEEEKDEDTPPPEAIGAKSGRAGLVMLAMAAAVLAAFAAFEGGRYLPSGATPTPSATPLISSSSVTPNAIDSLIILDPTPIATLAMLDPSPIPTHTHAVTVHTPLVSGTPVPTATKAIVAGQTGFLWVNARPWVQVYVDGKLVATETPLRKYQLPAGKHTIRFSNPAAKFSTENQVDIPAGGERSFFVDVKAGTVRPDAPQNR